MSCCHCYYEINQKEPCALPPGTIRSTISIFTVIIAFCVLSFLSVYFAINDEYSNSLGVAGILGSAVSTIIGYYFGSRGKEEIKDQVENKVHQEVVKVEEKIDNKVNQEVKREVSKKIDNIKVI